MLFAEFLNILCTNRDKSLSKKKEDFVMSLFKSTGLGFNYSSDYAKKLANPGAGGKHLTDDIREIYKKDYDILNVSKYLEETLKEVRIEDLFEAFNIKKKEKRDFQTFSEAAAYQFKAYMVHGEHSLPSSVANTYSLFLDQKRNGSDPMANEKALFHAKQELYSAVSNLIDINPDDDILTLKKPFENFFIGLNNVFRMFEEKCDRDGRNLLGWITDDVLNLQIKNEETFNINEYLEKITCPASLPFDLIKQINYIIYDNYSFEDKFTEVSVRLFDDHLEESMKIEALDSIQHNEYNEQHFSEYISFTLDGSERNLLNDALYILIKVDIILNAFEDNLEEYEPLNKINKRLIELYEKLNFQELSFFNDGIYYPLKKEIEYASTLENYFIKKDGTRIQAGDEKIKLDDFPYFKGLSVEKNFDEILFRFFNHEAFIYQIGNFDTPMAELITFNEDGTCRYYMYPVTCKAKAYRMIRTIAKRALTDRTIAFVAQSIMVSNKITEETLKMTSLERQEYGQDMLSCFGYYNRKMGALNATPEQIKKREYEVDHESKNFIYMRLIKSIIINEEIIKDEKKAN